MHFPSCASGRIGRTGRKLKIMTEATIALTSGRTAPNPHVEGAHHDNTLLYNVSASFDYISDATSDSLNSQSTALYSTAFMHFQRNSIFSANYRYVQCPPPSALRPLPSALRPPSTTLRPPPSVYYPPPAHPANLTKWIWLWICWRLALRYRPTQC